MWGTEINEENILITDTVSPIGTPYPLFVKKIDMVFFSTLGNAFLWMRFMMEETYNDSLLCSLSN